MSSVIDFVITREDLKKNKFTCPVCGHLYSGNGVGPSNNPLLTKALQAFLFISTKIFKEASIAHDVGYLVVPYMPMKYVEGDYEKICYDREDVDDLFYDLMLAEAAKRNFILKKYLLKAAEIFYEMVRDGGEESFKHVAH